MDSPTSPNIVALPCRNECQDTRGNLALSQAGASTRLYRFLGLSGVPFVVQKTRSWGIVRIQPARWVSKAARSAELIGITRRLLRVFGVPNFPSEYVSETAMLPRMKSSRLHLSARISPILMPVSTAVTTIVRHGSDSLVNNIRICAGAKKRRSFLASLSP